MDAETVQLFRCVLYLYNVCAGLPCVLQVDVSRDHTARPGPPLEICLSSCQSQRLDLNPRFTLSNCIISIFASRHTVCNALLWLFLCYTQRETVRNILTWHWSGMNNDALLTVTRHRVRPVLHFIVWSRSDFHCWRRLCQFEVLLHVQVLGQV